jgi:acyl dehydratase
VSSEGAELRNRQSNWFEDFYIGQRIRHARGLTIGDVENQMLSKLVMNTAQAHWNEDHLDGGALGKGRIVFGLITASAIFGLSSQDMAEQATAELGCTGLRFRKPVHHGDTLYALTEVTDKSDGEDPATGLLACRHWGLNQDEEIVFEGTRTLAVRRRP